MMLLMIALSLQVATSSTDQVSPKPVRQEVINTYFKAPPDTLTDMIIEADLVVKGRVIGASPRDTPAKPDQTASTRTAYRLRVDEILHVKDSRAVDATTIDIVRSGGERDRGHYIERAYQSGFPPFESGHEYVLFLTWNAALAAWVPAFGPDSAFDLRGGIVDSPGTAKVATALRGTPVSEFLASVRRFGR
jgi:hypothetical protein